MDFLKLFLANLREILVDAFERKWNFGNTPKPPENTKISCNIYVAEKYVFT